MLHWICSAAARAGIDGAEVLTIPRDASVASAWEIASRALGIAPVELAKLLAPVFGIDPVSLADAEPSALALIPQRIARQYLVAPLRDDGRRVIIATADPTNIEAEHAVGFATGRRPVFQLAAPETIEEALAAAHNGEHAMDLLLSTIDDDAPDSVYLVEDNAPEAVAASEVESAPVVKVTNFILRDAVAQGASDIHIEPGLKGGTVRFRVDGVLRRHLHLPMAALNRVVSRIKVLGKLDIADRIRPQDGRSKAVIDGQPIDLRISTVCTRDAEKVVIRLLRPESTRRLDDIGITVEALERLRQLLNYRAGIVIVTGPTGSGKTTTLYSAIREIATGEVNVSTVEDPVEYELQGTTQIQVDTKRGITFANSLRALLRQDPDVIFVGEIRDAETAHIAAQAAMTGHLVLATLHTNDAVSAVARLLDLGLDRQTIAATLRGTLAQRLVRRVCADCAQPVLGALTPNEQTLSQRYGVVPTWRAVGCRRCTNTGYRGRLPLVEVAVITPSLADAIAEGATVNALQREAVAQGMVTLRDAGVTRVLRGDTTLQELERVVGDTVEDEARSAPALSRPRASLLLVNADPQWRRMVRALLEGGDFEIVEASEAAEAAQRRMTGERFTVVLTGLPLAQEAQRVVKLA